MIVSIRVRDAGLQRDLADAVRGLGHEARPLRDPSHVGTDPAVAAVLLDDGLVDLKDYVGALRERMPEARTVLLSGRSDVPALCDALELGVDEIVRKPLELSCLAGALRAAGGGRPDAALGLAAEDRAMRAVLARLACVADTDVTVGVWGESGTGRSLVARALHDHGARRSGPFVEVSALEVAPAPPAPGGDDASFGPVADPRADAAGGLAPSFARARGGTLVLDGIEDFPGDAQQQLLELIEARGARGPGGPLDVRVVVVSERPLSELAARGALLESLARRLDVVSAGLPPLRARPDDVPVLARHFLSRLASELGQAPARLAADSEAALRARRWRCNVRELENLMARAAVVFPGTEIQLDWIDSALCTPSAREDHAGEELNLKQLERAAIARSLERTGGSRTEAARVLGISVRTLRNKIRRYELA